MTQTVRIGGKGHSKKFDFLLNYLGKTGKIEKGNKSDAARWIVDLAFEVIKRDLQSQEGIRYE